MEDPKPKKVCSPQQLEHLAKARVAALAKRREMMKGPGQEEKELLRKFGSKQESIAKLKQILATPAAVPEVVNEPEKAPEKEPETKKKKPSKARRKPPVSSDDSDSGSDSEKEDWRRYYKSRYSAKLEAKLAMQQPQVQREPEVVTLARDRLRQQVARTAEVHAWKSLFGESTPFPG